MNTPQMALGGTGTSGFTTNRPPNIFLGLTAMQWHEIAIGAAYVGYASFTVASFAAVAGPAGAPVIAPALAVSVVAWDVYAFADAVATLMDFGYIGSPGG